MPARYEDRTARSRRLFERAKGVFAGGVSHNGRYYDPYPLFVSGAKGQHLWDEDGNRYTDYWMGHMALILGHSPKVVVDALRSQIPNGTHYGMGNAASVELAEEVQKSVPCAESMRFCNSGAEATMYLERLARGFTGRRTVIKMAGGWHGYITDPNRGVNGLFDRKGSAEMLEAEQAWVKTVKFNDLGAAEAEVKGAGGEVAAIFLEPVLGAGGCIPADREYLKGLRELADRYGVLLAFDEIITGFRVALGGAQEWYGVVPDLATFGKIAGGGLPLGMVCGRKEILSLADPTRREKFVSIGGGTFSENPLSMAAGLATVRYLRRHAQTVYPKLAEMGQEARGGVDAAMAEEGVRTRTTGLGSLFFTHFGEEPKDEELASGGERSRAEAYALALMADGIFMLPGHTGGISTSHTVRDLKALVEKSRTAANSLKAAR